MQIVFINGRTERIGWRELQEALSHPATVALFIAGVIGFRLIPFTSDLPTLAPRTELLFWAHVLIVYVAAYVGAAAFCDRRGWRLMTPLLQGAIAGLLTLTGSAFYLTVEPEPQGPLTFGMFWLFLWALLLFFELIWVSFVFDLARPRPDRGAPVEARHGMQVLFVTGRREAMRFRDVYRVLFHPSTVSLTLLVVAGMALFHPYPVIRDLPVHEATKFWAQALAMFYTCFVALAWLCRRTGLTFVVPVALLAVSVAVTLSSGWFLSVMTGSAASADEIISYALFHWALLVLTEFVVVTFRLDRILAETAQSGRGLATVEWAEAGARRLAPPPPRPVAGNPAPDDAPAHPAAPLPPAGAQLVLQGVAIAVEDVEMAAAEEHYVRIVTADRSRLLRGRIADVESQMPPDLGLRVHRSYWVAGRIVQGLKRGEAGWTLMLSCGREVPVARGRQARVKAWVEGLRRSA